MSIMAGNVTWGPDRKTYTMAAPAHYPIFNSITDNPTMGDERTFVRVGRVTPEKTKLETKVEIAPGDKVLVYIYIHNNASATFNDNEHNHIGIAHGVRVLASFTETINEGEAGRVSAIISSENAEPRSVWGGASILSTAKQLHLRYVDGSAKIYNDWKANGTALSSDLFSKNGALIGLDSLDGVIPGCEEYHCAVTLLLMAE